MDNLSTKDENGPPVSLVQRSSLYREFDHMTIPMHDCYFYSTTQVEWGDWKRCVCPMKV